MWGVTLEAQKEIVIRSKALGGVLFKLGFDYFNKIFSLVRQLFRFQKFHSLKRYLNINNFFQKKQMTRFLFQVHTIDVLCKNQINALLPKRAALQSFRRQQRVRHIHRRLRIHSVSGQCTNFISYIQDVEPKATTPKVWKLNKKFQERAAVALRIWRFCDPTIGLNIMFHLKRVAHIRLFFTNLSK